jgi:hypothetical protein
MKTREFTKGFILVSASILWVYSAMTHLGTLIS